VPRDGRPASARRSRQDTAASSTASSPQLRRKMQDQRSRDTAPELAVRRLVHAAGLRYRVDRAPLPGVRRRADLVFGPVRLAVFIDGCFWHGCPEHGNHPRTNQQWWAAKLDRNRQRDRNTDERLQAAGWQVLRLWEHEDPRKAADRIRDAVRHRRGAHAMLHEGGDGARLPDNPGPARQQSGPVHGTDSTPHSGGTGARS